MAIVQLQVNKSVHAIDVPTDTPVLWVLRDVLGLTGTKFGCGKMQCGACTIHVEGSAVRSCLLPCSSVQNQKITTIEGLAQAAADSSLYGSLQQAWVQNDVPQCGYCQSGQIMAAFALLTQHPSPTDAQIDEAMDQILCRCGTYPRIRKAIHDASAMMKTHR